MGSAATNCPRSTAKYGPRRKGGFEEGPSCQLFGQRVQFVAGLCGGGRLHATKVNFDNLNGSLFGNSLKLSIEVGLEEKRVQTESGCVGARKTGGTEF